MDNLDYDRAHIWHPYTSMVAPLPSYEVVSAKGIRLKLKDGTELVDGMASWWCAIHGYNHPELNRAITDQLENMAHVMFGGITHAPAVRLAQALIDITPRSLQHVFFSDSGSVSVEVAIKMAIQFWGAQDKPHKSRLMTVLGGYHGDTFGAMSVCDPINGMHERFRAVLPNHVFLPRPETRFNEPLLKRDRDSLEQAFESHSNEIAAFVVEPIVQGAGGMWFYSREYLALLRELCTHYDVLLIADEIATGFGRTGELFACDHAGIEPDVMCLGKGLTGGYMSLAATLTTGRVAMGLSQDDGVLMHGPTFMANPLACAVARASVDLLIASDWKKAVADIGIQLDNELKGLTNHPAVNDVRTLGAVGVIETHNPVPVAELQRVFVDAGTWIRPFSNLVYVMPPYISEPRDLSSLTSAMRLGLGAL